MGVVAQYPPRVTAGSSGPPRASRTRQAAIVAAADLIAEGGTSAASVEAIAARAGITRGQFERAFSGAGACLLASFDEGLLRLARRLRAEAPGHGLRIQRIECGLTVTLRFIDEEPGWGRLLLLELPELAAERRRRALEWLIEIVVGSGFGDADDPAPSRAVVADAIAEALSLIRSRLRAGSGRPLADLGSQIMRQAVGPRFPRPEDSTRAGALTVAGHAQSDGSASARAVQVLRAIARTPNLNNRQVSLAVGLASDRDASVLLRSLEYEELIENLRRGTRPGKPNAWQLTELGRRVVAGEAPIVRPRVYVAVGAS